jgi:hypothetical protein
MSWEDIEEARENADTEPMAKVVRTSKAPEAARGSVVWMNEKQFAPVARMY